MIDSAKEVTYALSALTKKLPVRRSEATIRRWIRVGYRVPQKKRFIRMEFAIVGGCMYSSVEAYERFVTACTKAKIS